MKKRTKHRKGKGTVWYLSDVIVAITSMMTVLFMLFVAVLIIFIMSAQLDVNVIGFMLYGVPKTDSTLLAFLDSTVNDAGDRPMKELLSYAVWEGEMNITMDSEEIDLKTTSEELIEQLTTKAYVLKLILDDEEVVLASKGAPEDVEHIEAETILQGGERRGKLTLVIAK